MALWDPSIFIKTLKVVGVQIPSEKTGTWLKQINGALLKQRNLKPVQSTTKTTRLLYLDPTAYPSVQSIMNNEVLATFVREQNADVKLMDVELNYDSYQLDEALRLVLPPDIPEIPSAFETIGHIAHLNLKAWHLPYKRIIGQLILDVRCSSPRCILLLLN